MNRRKFIRTLGMGLGVGLVAPTALSAVVEKRREWQPKFIYGKIENSIKYSELTEMQLYERMNAVQKDILKTLTREDIWREWIRLGFYSPRSPRTILRNITL